MDIITAKDDYSGNWDISSEVDLNRVSNFLKIQPLELKFIKDGLDILDWLSSSFLVSLGAFIAWLKLELIRRSFAIKNIENYTNNSGKLTLIITLISGNKYHLSTSFNINRS